MVLFLILLTVTLTLLLAKPDSFPSPNILTPHIELGNIDIARVQSKVDNVGIDIPDSYAGYITVNKSLGNHLFFWFFPKTQDDDVTIEKKYKYNITQNIPNRKPGCSPDGRGENRTQPPLLLWLNGGPGISSMLGLFWEHGPLEVISGSNGRKATFKKRLNTWSKHYSMLYIDNPVGVGYSYSNSGQRGFRLTQEGYALDLREFVEQFFKLFPEYLCSDFYIGGQSYAGRYIPVLGYKLHEDIVAKKTQIPLVGVYLGGPYYDCEKQMRPFSQYLYTVGAFSHHDMVQHHKNVTELFEIFKSGNKQNLAFDKVFPVLVPKAALKTMDNYVTQQEAGYIPVTEVMTSSDMRKRLKIHKDKEYVCTSNTTFFSLYSKDIFLSTTDKLTVLLDNYKTLIYTGDYDVVVSSRMVDEALMQTPWSGQQEFNISSRHPWTDLRTRRLRGFYSRVGRFCRVVVHGAGHQTPHDQPESSLDMIRRFVEYGCVGGKV